MPGSGRAAAFIDRDGVINADLGHVHRSDQFQVLPGAARGLRLLKARGYALVVITNQAGIAKGLYSVAEFESLNEHMRAVFAKEQVVFDAIYYCPHHPDGVVAEYSIACGCRKPMPGMLLAARDDLGLSLPDSVLIGDQPTDIAAGRAAGVRRTVLIRRPSDPPLAAADSGDYVCRDLSAAAAWVCDNEPRLNTLSDPK
jgi:D-glycero-D-manno-heptose 1,7-bisphosphate phosphatase